MAGRLEGKVAIVTGAGSIGPGWGNGKATAVLFAREGAKVVAVDIKPESGQETCRLIEEEGGEAMPVVADVSRADDVAGIFDACLERYGRIDVLHNNVGIVGKTLTGTADCTEEDWDHVFAINAKSVMLTCRSALPIMARQGKGSIINVSSTAGVRYMGIAYPQYAASKAAIIQLTQNIALEYVTKGVRCNAILPGLIDTPMVRAALIANYDSMDELVAERDALSPTGKMGEAWDVAYAALFLASDESKYVTGVQLPVDGGLINQVRG
jgi:NAD(P)-dependent dehydrogenase (short-subunit alcohol dehydrogenase family)